MLGQVRSGPGSENESHGKGFLRCLTSAVLIGARQLPVGI